MLYSKVRMIIFTVTLFGNSTKIQTKKAFDASFVTEYFSLHLLRSKPSCTGTFHFNDLQLSLNHLEPLRI